MSSPEKSIQSQIMLDLGSRPGIRLFRNNTGQAWTGEVIDRTPATITLRNPRPLHAGLCVGSSDLIGFKSLTIGPEHVGQTIAQFVALEIKSKTGRPTEEQRNFLRVVQESGGAAGLARSIDDALAVVGIITPGSGKTTSGESNKLTGEK